MDIIELLKVIFLGIVEGITEWLPVSSTGHLILVNEFIHLNASESFMEMFNVVIQLGAVLSVVVLFFKKLWPFKSEENKIKPDKDKFTLWFKIIVAVMPAAVIGILFDDFLDAHLSNYIVISITLILYGVLFILVENRKLTPKINSISDLSYKTAILIGAFQVLSLIPGTSRSGVTIIGALLIGVSRVVATEFTFFLAIPVMFGASFVKLLKFGFNFTATELIILSAGFITAFLVSLASIKFLTSFVKKHNFKPFGYYRIALGALVLIYFLIIK